MPESIIDTSTSTLTALNYTYIAGFDVINGGELTTASNSEVIPGNRNAANGVSTTIDGLGSGWNVTGDLRDVNDNPGGLTISHSAKLAVTGALDVGDTTFDQSLSDSTAATADGVPSITGNQSGNMAINSGGTVTSSSGILGDVADTTGTVTIDGSGSNWTVAGGAQFISDTTALFIGNSGTGTVNVTGGGTLSSGSLAVIGYLAGSNGSVTVDGEGSAWNSYGITAGASGTGSLTVSNQGVVNASGGMQIGAYGTASGNILQIQSGGDVVSGDSVFIGIGGDSGSATITGASSSLAVNDGPLAVTPVSLRVGSSGGGTLDVLSGASLTTGSGVTTTIGGASNSGVGNGMLSITGAGSTATLGGSLLVGDAGGTGLVSVGTGATLQVNAGTITLGSSLGGHGTLALYGGTLALPNIPLQVGVAGRGELDIEDGSALNLGSQTLVLGQQSIGSGTVKVVNGGELSVGGLTLGGAGTGELDIGGTDISGATGPGTVNVAGQLNIGVSAGSTGRLTINGASTLSLGGISAIGDAGHGTIDLESGAQLTLGAVTLGNQAGGNGMMTVAGGSSLTTLGDLTVGNGGIGSLTVNGGNVSDSGYLNVGKSNQGSSVSVTSGGKIVAQGGLGYETIGQGGAAAVIIDGSGSSITLGQGAAGGLKLYDGSSITVSGSGLLKTDDVGDILSGNLTVTGAGSSYTASSALDVNGGGTLSVLAGASASAMNVNLGLNTGSGLGQGTVMVDAGSTLSIGGTLFAFNGSNVTVSNGSTLSAIQGAGSSIGGSSGMASTLLVTGQDSVADFGGGSFSVGSAGTPSNDTGYVQVLGGGQLDTGGTTLSGGLTKTGYVSGVGSDWMTNDLTIQNSADVLADQGGSLIVSGNAAVQSNSTLRADGGTINVSGNLNLGTDSVAASDLSLQNSSTLAVTGFIQSGNLVSPQNSITLASSNVSASQLNLDNTTMTLINASSLTVYHAALLQSKLTVDATSNIVRLLGLGVGQRSVLNLSAGSSMTVSQSVELSGGTINLGNAGLLTIGSGTLNGPPHQLTIFPNGVLSGVGTIIGSTFNGGVVHVGDDPGTMTIEGNYQQVPGSTLAIEVGPSSTSLLVTTGAATIQGGTLSLIPVSGAMINLGQTYTVLTAAGGVTGAFTTVDTSSPFITLSPALTGDIISFTAAHAPNSFAAVAQTANQAAVAHALDQAATAASPRDFNNGLTTFSNATAAGARASFDSLSGEAYGDLATAAFDQSYAFSTVLLDRLNDLANGSGDSIRLAANGSGNDVGLRFTTAAQAAGPGGDPAFAGRPYFVWADGTGDFSGASGENGSHGFNATSAGVAAGIDARFTQNWMLGLALGYDHDSLSANGLESTGTADNYNIALYSGLTLSRAYVHSAIGYSDSNDAVNRLLDIGGAARGATGKPDGQQVFGTTETGYEVPLNAALIAKPFVRLDAAHYWQTSFAETGANGFDLLVAGQTANTVQSTLGTKLVGQFNVVSFAAPLTATAMVGWGHEFARTARPLTAAFAGAPGLPFAVDAAEVDRNTAILGATISITAGKAKIFIRYNGQYGASTHDSAVTGGVSVAW